jgi:hypothetical protein
MGFLDKLKQMLTGKVDDHGEQIGAGIDKGAGVAEEKTGGKFDDKIDTGADKLKDGLDSLDGKDDDIP